MARIVGAASLLALLLTVTLWQPLTGSAAEPSTVMVDASRPLQVMAGLGVNANVHSWKQGELRPAIGLIAATNPGPWRVIIDRQDWEAANDDGDPSHFNWDYYDQIYSQGKMADLWATLADIESRPGQVVVLDLMGGVPAWMGGSRIDPDDEAEWVEMVASLVYYARNVKHLDLSLLGPMNEPDWDGNEGPQVGSDQYVRLLHALAVRLDDLDLGDVRFVGPDTASSSAGASDYVPAMAADPLVWSHTAHFAVHSYSGSAGELQDSLAALSGTSDFWMTEFSAPCSGCDNGAPNPGDWSFAAATAQQWFALLDQGAAGGMIYDGWDGYYEHHGKVGYWGVLAYDADSGTYMPRKTYYVLEQFTHDVPRGAARVEADSDDGSLSVEAFHDAASGRVTIVMQNTSDAARTVTGAIAGAAGESTLSGHVTSATMSFEPTQDVSVAGGRFTVDVPPDSLVTLTGAPGEPSTPVPDPTPAPAPDPTAGPAPEPAPDPTVEPAPDPTEEPAPDPTVEPAPDPTVEPAPDPTEEPAPARRRRHRHHPPRG